MNAPNCKDILNLIPLYIDDILDSEEKDKVVEHINSCKNCHREFELMAAIMHKTQELPEIGVPENFHKDLMDKAAALNSKKCARRIMILRRSSAGVAAAAVIALSVVSFGNINKVETDITSGNSPVVSATPTPEATEENATNTTPKTRNETRIEEPVKPQDYSKDAYHVTSDDTVISEPISGGGSLTAPEVGGGGSSAAVPDAAAPVTPEKAVTSTEAAVLCDDSEYLAAEITLDDSNRRAVLDILSQYEKDEIGYKVPDIDAVLRQIAELGVEVNAQECNFSSNYIIVK